MTAKQKEILEAYKFRYSCKKFDETKKISDEDFNFLLETLRLSPSSFGFEPWRFLILQNKEIQADIAPYSWGGRDRAATASHYIVFLSRKSVHMKHGSPYLQNFMTDVQQLSPDFIKMKAELVRKFQEEDRGIANDEKLMFEWAARNTYISLGNIMTAAAMIGIDSCPIEGFSPKDVDNILGNKHKLYNPNEFGAVVMLALGYRASDDANAARPKTRQKLEQVVQWVK